MDHLSITAEGERLQEAAGPRRSWRLWGPYLSERQWGTVREDYSAGGDAWGYLPHDHSRSRVYRWGEDGLAGLSDERQRLCLALALWNGRDPILKERLFGLTNAEGNHGEDVKEHYYGVHAVTLALVDPAFAKDQLVELGHAWYQHPNGQLPAYEWSFGDANPPYPPGPPGASSRPTASAGGSGARTTPATSPS
jgi:hypothetical protein